MPSNSIVTGRLTGFDQVGRKSTSGPSSAITIIEIPSWVAQNISSPSSDPSFFASNPSHGVLNS